MLQLWETFCQLMMYAFSIPGNSGGGKKNYKGVNFIEEHKAML